MEKELLYFLDDAPKKSLEVDDAFGHLYYARTLYQILENTISIDSYSIGLFGIWGVGKTSIINELKRIINKESSYKLSKPRNSYRLEVLDAWEYSEDNFRREFLLDLSENFNYKEEIENKLSKKRVVEKKEATAYDLRWFGNLFLQFLALFAIAFTGYFLVGLSNIKELPNYIQVVFQFLLPTLIGLFATFQDNIKQLFTFNTIIEEIAPAVYPDEFKRLFNDIVIKAKLKDKDRLIIVLDNLDRVKEEIVLQILSAVKTFINQPRCIYILPCDDKGLKQHIISSRSGVSNSLLMTQAEANEYLRKFFQTTLTIRDLLKDDIVSFINKVLSQIKIFSDPILDDTGKVISDFEDVAKRNLEDVESVFQVIASKNPRRIIQLTNKLSANFLLANEKKSIDPSLARSIATNLGFLAKLTVIEEEWPNFYEILVRNPDIFPQITSYFITESDSSFPALLHEYEILDKGSEENPVKQEWDNELSNFLSGTNHITSPRPSAFLHFKQPRVARDFPSFYEFKDAAYTGNIDRVEEIIKTFDGDISIPFSILISEIEGLSLNRTISSLINVMKVTIAGAYLIPSPSIDLTRRVSNTLVDQLSRSYISDQVLFVGLDRLLKILHHSSRIKNIDVVISSVISKIDIAGKQEETKFIANQLFEHKNLISVPNRKSFREVITKSTETIDSIIILREIVNIYIEHGEDEISSFIPKAVYDQNINILESPGKEAEEGLVFVAQHQNHFPKSTFNILSSTLIEHLKSSGDTINERTQFALTILQKLTPSSIGSLSLDEISRSLTECYSKFTNQEHKNEIGRSYLQIMPLLSNSNRSSFHPHLLHFTQHSSPADLLNVFQAIKDSGNDLYELDALLSAARNRTVVHVETEGLRQKFFSICASLDKPGEIESYVIAIGDKPNHILPTLNDAEKHMSPPGFRDALRALFPLLDSLQESHFSTVLRGLVNFSGKFDQKFRKELTERILNNWLRNPSIEVREGAYELWASYQEKDEVLRSLFHERLLEYSIDAINTGQIANEIEYLYLKFLARSLSYLRDDHRQRLFQLGLRMVEKERPENVITKGYDLLASFSGDKDTPGIIIDELINDLREETKTAIIRSIHNALTRYIDRITREQMETIKLIVSSENSESMPDEILEYWSTIGEP